ncbi:beta-lactam sensor/signal transducer [Massilia terrae]|uniref:Peptidase M56 n=1 Tax=Massilia terrae TaxID=1811224 RepID=A0ABT2D0D3_9BURK|nr:M56 family metallopeptidase [Massilia terrae]MCS0659677.1 peptidase M56 [Massilia terrae]
MNAILSAFVPSLGWALLDFVWQGLLVGWCAALLLALLGKARPQVRYAIACAALLLCAALPIAGTVHRMLAEQGAPASSLPLALADAAAITQAVPAGVALPVDQLAIWQAALQQRLPLVILAWSVGAGLLALRMLLGLLWVRRLSRPGRYARNPAWQARLDRLAAAMGIARRVTLGVVDELGSPVTAGWWRPVVLVPASLLSGMPPDLLEALLAHELAHVRRFDYLVNLIQSAIEILLFYHPTVWWLSNRIRVEREQIADDLAASTLGEPRRLALALSELDLFQLSTPQLAHAAHGGDLMSRIKRLVRPESEPLNWKLALPILGLAVCAAIYTHAGTAQAATDKPAARDAAVHQQRDADDSYALVRDDVHGTNINGDSRHRSEIKEIKRHVNGEFLWFRDGGKSYIVQDQDILRRVDAAWAPVDKLGEQMNVYGEQMDVHGKKMAVLGKQIEADAARIKPMDQKTSREFERKMNELGRQMNKLGERFASADGAERDRLERKMSELGRQMEELGRRFGEQIKPQIQQQVEVSMKATSGQMEELRVPMDELGKKMGELGKQMEREAKSADKTVGELIREAQAKGLAQPAPLG